MTHELPELTSDHEYLDLKQAAILCSVSDERFSKWIDKGVIPVFDVHGRKLIHSHDLIQHLVRHNIPIPDRLLQGKSKKILFVLADDSMPNSMTADVIWALYQLRKQTPYIFDFIQFDSDVELKIITFAPDRIVLLQADAGNLEPEQRLRDLSNDQTPIFVCAGPQTTALSQFLCE